MGNSLKNIFKENVFIKNTSNKNIVKHILKVYLIVILRSVFSLKIFCKKNWFLIKFNKYFYIF